MSDTCVTNPPYRVFLRDSLGKMHCLYAYSLEGCDAVSEAKKEIERLQAELRAWHEGRATVIDRDPIRVAISPSVAESANFEEDESDERRP